MTDPAEKYRDRIDPFHQMAMDSVAFANMAMGSHREHLEHFVEAERRSHSVMHITDPTLYRDMIQSKSFALQIRMAKAALAFLREIEAISEEVQ